MPSLYSFLSAIHSSWPGPKGKYSGLLISLCRLVFRTKYKESIIQHLPISIWNHKEEGQPGTTKPQMFQILLSLAKSTLAATSTIYVCYIQYLWVATAPCTTLPGVLQSVSLWGVCTGTSTCLWVISQMKTHPTTSTPKHQLVTAGEELSRWLSAELSKELQMWQNQTQLLFSILSIYIYSSQNPYSIIYRQ